MPGFGTNARSTALQPYGVKATPWANPDIVRGARVGRKETHVANMVRGEGGRAAKHNTALDAPRPEPVLRQKKENPCLSDRQCHMPENPKPAREANDTLRWVPKPAREQPPQPVRRPVSPPAPPPAVPQLSAKEREERWRAGRKHHPLVGGNSDEPTKLVEPGARNERSLQKQREVARARGPAANVPDDDVDYSRPGAFYAAMPRPKTEKERFEEAAAELQKRQPQLSGAQAMAKINAAMLTETAKSLNPQVTVHGQVTIGLDSDPVDASGSSARMHGALAKQLPPGAKLTKKKATSSTRLTLQQYLQARQEK